MELPNERLLCGLWGLNELWEVNLHDNSEVLFATTSSPVESICNIIHSKETSKKLFLIRETEWISIIDVNSAIVYNLIKIHPFKHFLGINGPTHQYITPSAKTDSDTYEFYAVSGEGNNYVTKFNIEGNFINCLEL